MVKEAFQKYLTIAITYGINGNEISKVEKIVNEALGEKYPPAYKKPIDMPF